MAKSTTNNKIEKKKSTGKAKKHRNKKDSFKKSVRQG